MKLIFIRHAEPDYSIDSLTEKGFCEAQLLAKRTAGWKVTDFYCSPLGRAVRTSEPTLKAHQRTAVTYDWLQEFRVLVPDYFDSSKKHICWDFYPEQLNNDPLLFDPLRWHEADIMKDSGIKEHYTEICNSLDQLLSQYGYERDQFCYKTSGKAAASNAYMQYNGTTKECMKNAPEEETTIVFFCHLGISLALISHLLNSSPCTLWQGIFLPPSSVTVLSAEERIPGEAYFRCQMIGDTSHLRAENEPVSFYGGFAAPFQG